jgi:hypothetical protein
VRRTLPLLVALAAVAAVLIPYAALGGASYHPTPLADPCKTRDWRNPSGLATALEQVVLSGLDGAACDLGVSREELVLALVSDASLERFAAKHGIGKADAEQAVQKGLVRAVDDAETAGALPGFVAGIARRVVETVPPPLLLDAIQRLGSLIR